LHIWCNSHNLHAESRPLTRESIVGTSTHTMWSPELWPGGDAEQYGQPYVTLKKAIHPYTHPPTISNPATQVCAGGTH
jgi:hypothetical protein